MTSPNDLSRPELDVLLLLTSARETSIVSLAADVWRMTPDWRAFDPYPLLVYVLDSLASKGLVRFRLVKPYGGSDPDMPFDIRLTTLGWAMAGYPLTHGHVGHGSRHSRDAAKHQGDMTNYRNHADRAKGGDIEVEDFPTHRAHYPDHSHMYGVPLTMANATTSRAVKRTERLADPTVLADPNGTGDVRGYIRVTPDIEARVLAARERLGQVGYADIAEVAGLPERTVKYVLTDLPRLRRASTGDERLAKSLKERVFAIVEAIGEVKDVPELRRILGMADTEHDVMHVLHSLHTRGRIDFDERGNGMGTATVINIRLPKRGAKRPDREANEPAPEILTFQLPEAAGPEATTEEAPPSTPPSAPESESEGYPLLDALLDRERTRQEADAKGMAFVVAAEAVQDIDPETAATLMAKASQYNVPFPSPIEQEYIRYVANHPSKEAE